MFYLTEEYVNSLTFILHNPVSYILYYLVDLCWNCENIVYAGCIQQTCHFAFLTDVS